ncbi:MAG: glutamate 5-kinase [Alphaproteobacteria bacterium]
MIAPLASSRRLVVKIGSAPLVDEAGDSRREWLVALTDDLAALRADGTEVLIVSSGAIALGRRLLGLARGPRNRALRLEESQAAAAAGQIRLAHAWQETLARHGIAVAQILLTLDDSENRRRYLNARSTISTLLRFGVVPVINENDSIATDEIRYGDNDRLAARVAQMASADTCVLLSDVDGLYTGDPNRDPNANHVPVVERITPEIVAMAGEPGSEDGSGGMVTKLEAARIATQAGCRLVIASCHSDRPLRAVDHGARCTWFLPLAEPQTARKQWIAGTLRPVGDVVVDPGAARALAAGKSLLPAGVTAIRGHFQRGDTVVVRTPDGRELARGLVAYSSEDARLIKGHKSNEIEALLGYRGREEMIHRDDLVLS